MQKFSKTEAVAFGWKTIKAHIWMLIPVFLMVWLIPVVAYSIAGGFASFNFNSGGDFDAGSNGIASLLSWGISTLLAIGLLKILLSFADTGTAEFDELFTNYKLFIKYAFTSILLGIIVFFGFVLLIIPGIIFSTRLQFAPYFVVDKGVGPFEAIRKSWGATRGSFFNLILLWLMFIGINFVGFLALGIGLLVTIPLTGIALAHVYRKLESGASNASSPASAPSTA
ncbi:hypothetical protein CMO96_02305 [Candidatus Woesebacteria bacterium]|nr:hypothetical protein [Candidatus Woesebacteria bacterium]